VIRKPDRYSLDRVLGIRLPVWVGPLGLVGVLLTVLYVDGADDEPSQQEQEAQEESRE
jgi:hypothetical protein